MTVEAISPVDFPDWDGRLIRSGDQYSFFHSSAWAAVLQKTYGYTPSYFVQRDDCSFTSVVPMMQVMSRLTGCRGVSLPFSDYCDAIVRDGTHWEAIFERIKDRARQSGWNYIEFRGGRFFPIDAPFSFHYGHKLDLGRPPERLSAGLDGAVRRNIRKALKEGVEIEESGSLEAVREFYRLNRLTRKEHGLPPQPYQFFCQIHEQVISKGQGFVLLGRYRKKAVAGAIFFHIGKKALYKYGASDRRWQLLRANNLLMWEAITRYAQRGFRTFCFGRTEPDNEGLRRFKAGWGAKEDVIRYYRYDSKHNAFLSAQPRGAGPFQAVFRKLPVFVLTLAGKLLYRHMG